jgi:hypothetical protein
MCYHMPSGSGGILLIFWILMNCAFDDILTGEM